MIDAARDVEALPAVGDQADQTDRGQGARVLGHVGNALVRRDQAAVEADPVGDGERGERDTEIDDEDRGDQKLVVAF